MDYHFTFPVCHAFYMIFSLRKRVRKSVRVKGKSLCFQMWAIIAASRCVTRAICDSEKALNSVSRIDRVSRVVFPATYIVINIIYW